MAESTFREHVASALRREASAIGADWVRQVQQQPSVARADRVFPEQALEDLVPRLVHAIAAALEQGETVSDPALLHELQRLTRLRRSQGFDSDELAGELELLYERLHEAAQDAARSWGSEAPAAEVLEVAHRLGRVHLDLLRTVRRAWSEPHPNADLHRAQVLTRFSRTLNHELRNHVYALQMQVRLLREPRILADEARRDQLLDRLKEGLGRMSSATTDTLHEELGAAPGEAEARIPLPRLVEALRSDLERHAAHRQVVFRVGPLPDLMVPEARLQLALLNTVGHAIRRAPAGSPVELGATVHEGALELTVADQGPALGPEELEQLMVLDTQVERVTDQRLDLWTTREVLRPLGGDLVLSCEDGRCVYRLVLPPPAEGAHDLSGQPPGATG